MLRSTTTTTTRGLVTDDIRPDSDSEVKNPIDWSSGSSSITNHHSIHSGGCQFQDLAGGASVPLTTKVIFIIIR